MQLKKSQEQDAQSNTRKTEVNHKNNQESFLSFNFENKKMESLNSRVDAYFTIKQESKASLNISCIQKNSTTLCPLISFNSEETLSLFNLKNKSRNQKKKI